MVAKRTWGEPGNPNGNKHLLEKGKWFFVQSHGAGQLKSLRCKSLDSSPPNILIKLNQIDGLEEEFFPFETLQSWMFMLGFEAVTNN